MNEDILRKIGYNSLALEMMLKRESQIDHNDIIFESDIPRNRPEILSDDDIPNTGIDYSNLEISLPKMKELFVELVQIAKSLPDQAFEDDDPYDNGFRENKYKFIDLLDNAALKLDNLLDEATVQNDPSIFDTLNG